MAAPLPALPDPDRLPRRILGLCAALSLAVPVLLVAGVLAVVPTSSGGLGPALRGTLWGSLVALAWAVPVGLLLAPLLNRAERPVLRGLLRTLWDLPTVAIAVVVGRLQDPGTLAIGAIGLVVLPHVALGAARALERTPRGSFRAATALGMSRRRFARRIGVPRVRGAMTAAILSGWARGVGEAVITWSILGSGALSGQLMARPQQSGQAALVLLAVALGVPLLTHRLART